MLCTVEEFDDTLDTNTDGITNDTSHGIESYDVEDNRNNKCMYLQI